MTSIPKRVTRLAASAQTLREGTETHSLLEDIVRF
jgi:hypothetical protein